MRTTADMVGLSAGDGLVHIRATLIILIASSLLKSDPNWESTSSIRDPFFCTTRACKISAMRVEEGDEWAQQDPITVNIRSLHWRKDWVMKKKRQSEPYGKEVILHNQRNA
nr:hypothetical protein B296_00019203 [Ipomoea trifida]